MENHNAITITSPIKASDTPIAGGITGACNEEQREQFEAMVKALPLNSRAILLATLPFLLPYTVTEALLKVIEKLNPKNWPIFKNKSFNDLF